MRKLFNFLCALAAVAMIAVSCSKEEALVEPKGEMATVTFSAAVPGGVATRAINDGTNINALYYEVYTSFDKAPVAEGKVFDADGNKTFTVELQLVNDQTYNFIFWAQVDPDAANGNGHYNTSDLRNVSILNYADEQANDESRAAFFAVEQNLKITGAINKTITLKRPFAQLNFATTTYESAALGEVTVNSSKVVVKNAATSFNTLLGQGEGSSEVTFAATATPNDPATINVNNTNYNWLSMNYLMVQGDGDVVELDAYFDVTYCNSVNGTIHHNLKNISVKENYRTNIIGDLIFNTTKFEVVVDEKFDTPDVDEGNPSVITSQTAFEAALQNGGTIYIAKPVSTKSSDVPAYIWKNTNKDVEIVGAEDGVKISFGTGALNGSDGAKNITFDNLTLQFPNVNYTGFHHVAAEKYRNCTIEGQPFLYGVTASFNNCTFVQTSSDAYNVWTYGAKVANFENCTFNSAGKAALVYKESGTEVYTANFTDCKFYATTPVEGKAAIEIDASLNPYVVNIAKCTAEGFANGSVSGISLWNVKKGAENATVNFVAYATNTATLAEALQGGAPTIYLAAGNYELSNAATPVIKADNVKIIGEDKDNCKVTITKQLRADGKSLTLQNLTTAVPTGLSYTEHDFAFIHYFKEFKMVDCKSDGRIRLNCHKATIENCEFNVTTSDGFDGYAIYYYGPDKSEVTVNKSKFNTVGKAIVIYSEGPKVYDLNVNECEFISTASTDKAAIQMHTEHGITGTVDITSSTVTGFADVNGGLWNELNNSTKVPTDNFVITIDGIVNNIVEIHNVEEMLWFANEVNVNKRSFSTKIVKLTADIDLAGIDWEPIGQTGATTFNGIFDGQNHTISNLNIDSEDQTGAHYSSGLFGWVESHSENQGHIKNVNISGATVKGHHNCGALVGYITEKTALVENCHVSGAAISCTMYDSEANGDKAGALIGNATVATPVKDCSASNSTVSAGRDGGQVIGAGKEANVTGCSATDVTVTANGTSTGANIRNEVIGRLL